MIRISTWMLAVAVAALAVSGLRAQQTTSAPMLLESAKQKMTIGGDLRGCR